MGREPSSGGRGRGRSRFGGRGRGRSNFTKKNVSQTKEMKFYPHGSGSQQSVTFDTVKNHIVQLIQKTYKNGVDIAESLQDEVMKDLTSLKPRRVLSTLAEDAGRAVEQSAGGSGGRPGSAPLDRFGLLRPGAQPAQERQNSLP